MKVVRTGLVALVAAAATVAVRTTLEVRRLRRRGGTVRALPHDLDLPGRFPPRRLVVLGDSAAAGHGLPDADVALPRLIGVGLRDTDGRATAVCSVAADGVTTEGVVDAQLDAVEGAEVVVIGVGVNDAVRPRHRVVEVAATTREMLEGVQRRAAPGARIVLMTCPDLSAAPGLPAVLRPPLGWRCRSIAVAQQAEAARMAVTTVASDRSLVTADLFGPDGFHPGLDAHRRMAQRVVAAITAS